MDGAFIEKDFQHSRFKNEQLRRRLVTLSRPFAGRRP